MTKTKISEFSSTPGNNTDIDGINLAEGCAPSGINNAIRELMSQLKDFQAGTAGDSFNGPIGTTTAAAGAFTTLTTSGAVTHNAGTANGVPYLNGSKVLTSGGALTFDGTGLQVGGGASGAIATINGNVNGGAVIGQRSGTNRWFIGDTASAFGSGTGLTSYVYENNPFIWFNAGVPGELMRLTSTGLGIGTSSPSQKLAIQGASFVGSSFNGHTIGDAAAQRIRIGYNDGTPEPGLVAAQLSANATVLQVVSRDIGNGAISFHAGSGVPEQMRLTSTGLGIGTSSPSDKLEIGGAGAGIILTSPNGTRFRITVSNAGALTVSAV